MAVRLLLLATAACHLCEEAETIVRHFQTTGLSVEYLDIAEHEEWQAQYAIRIPVLYHPETRADLGWPFDQTAVAAFIETIKHE
jgi:hypothetical protein